MAHLSEKPVSDALTYIAFTSYFGPDKSYAPEYGKMTPVAIAQLYYEAAANTSTMVTTFSDFARSLGVGLATYEAGPGYDVGAKMKPSPQLSNYILANRNKEMRPAMIRNAQDVYWKIAGTEAIYHQFTVQGKCSRFGCWGATEFFSDVWTMPEGSPKRQAVEELAGGSELHRHRLEMRVPAQVVR